MNQTLMKELLGCPLLEITHSYWAIKFTNDKWVCEAQYAHDFRRASRRHLDYAEDIVASGDYKRIRELWLLCPPSHTSPLGNTARIPILTPCTAFQFKIGMVDTAGVIGPQKRTTQAHIIGRVNNSDGECECFAWDYVEDGLITPQTTKYDPTTQHIVVNDDGTPFYPLQTNVNRFGWRIYRGEKERGMWRDSLAPAGQLDLQQLGIEL